MRGPFTAVLAVACVAGSTSLSARGGMGHAAHFEHFGRSEAGGRGLGVAPHGDYRNGRMPYGYSDGCSGGDLGGSELDLGRRSRIDAYSSGCE
jgi:hypothetical protein